MTKYNKTIDEYQLPLLKWSFRDIDKLMNKFGYSEMYEWSELFEFNIVPYGRFVTFDSNEPGKIKLAQKKKEIVIL